MENEVKEPATKYNHISSEDYLVMERTSPEKCEYFDRRLNKFKHLSDSFVISAIGLTLLLQDVYEDVRTDE